jgi:hypothetical protein
MAESSDRKPFVAPRWPTRPNRRAIAAILITLVRGCAVPSIDRAVRRPLA